MTARILEGKAVAAEIQDEVRERTSQFREATGVVPCLAAVLVGEDPASQVYVRNKQRACERVGIDSQLHRLNADIKQTELEQLVESLNENPDVHGILVQLPLPDGLDSVAILDKVIPAKDVDAFHPHNVGLISQGRPRFLPCTPHGIQQLLARRDITVQGKHVVVVGRSDIVGKPMASMLVNRGSALGATVANATVTVCHSRTDNLAGHCRQADILIAAIGKAKFIMADMVKPGATVIDVGINRNDEGKLVGDVDFDAVCEVAGAITPVPGGVGPLTISMLLHNTLEAARQQQ